MTANARRTSQDVALHDARGRPRTSDVPGRPGTSWDARPGTIAAEYENVTFSDVLGKRRTTPCYKYNEPSFKAESAHRCDGAGIKLLTSYVGGLTLLIYGTGRIVSTSGHWRRKCRTA